MVRTYLLVIFLLFLQNFCSAQGFNAHLSGGFNASQIDGDLFSGYNKIGIHGGLGIGYELDDNWSIESGLFYNALGSQKELQVGNTTPEEQQKIKLTYVSVPIDLIYDIEPVPVSIGAGMQFSYLLSSAIQDRADDAILDFFNKTDITVAFSVRYQFSDLWSFSLKASEGVSLIFNNNKESAINSNSLRNRYLTFSLNRHL